MTDFKKLFSGKRVLIWGLGLHGGGLGAALFFAMYGARVTVTDLATKETLAPIIKKLSKYKDIRYVLGEHREEDFINADIIIRNPAIKDDNPYLLLAKKRRIQVENDIGLFFQYSPAFSIGITGSKGKSTLTQLVYELINQEIKKSRNQKNKNSNHKSTICDLQSFNSVLLGGNIRVSVFDALEKADSKSIVVLELSSFQLDHAFYAKKSPQIAIITNIYDEHINYHGNRQNYEEAKKNILRFQEKNDIALLSESVRSWKKETKAKTFFFDGTTRDGLFKFAEIFNIEKSLVEETLKNFRGLEGRQEVIGRLKNGAVIVNDTTATHPRAVIFALQKYENPVLIAGGVDKLFATEDVSELAKIIRERNLRLVLLPGDFSDNLANLSDVNVVRTENMTEAVVEAVKLSGPSDTILLSPGAASFNLFANEFERGKKFVENMKKFM